MKIGVIMPIKGGIINATASVARVHRALICASLSDKETYIESNELPDDISATIKDLNSKGAKIRYNGGGFEVIPIPLELPKSDRGDKEEYWLQGDKAYSSISGLFFTLPLLSTDSRIIIQGKEEYRSYIDMTIDMLKAFSVEVERKSRDDGGAEYKICAGQRFITPGKIKAEGDWTNSAFWLCAAAIQGDGIICSNLSRSSRQADKEVVSILERFSAVAAYKGDSVAVRRNRLRSIRIDAAEAPDIMPAVAIVAAVTEGQSIIYNAERVGLVENGMMKKISTALLGLGADVVPNSDGLVIIGKQRLRGGVVSSQGDHRIAMMTAIASGVCDDTVAIVDALAVNKSYPDFYDDFEKMGGQLLKKIV